MARPVEQSDPRLQFLVKVLSYAMVAMVSTVPIDCGHATVRSWTERLVHREDRPVTTIQLLRVLPLRESYRVRLSLLRGRTGRREETV